GPPPGQPVGSHGAVHGYLLRRSLTFLITLGLAAALSYLVLLVLPGDPAQVMLGLDPSPEALAAWRRQLGLDRPPLSRFAAGLAVALPLVAGSMLLACLIAVPLGSWAAVRRDGLAGWVVSGATALGQAIPSFALGLLLMSGFAVRLGWFPAGGFPPWSQGLLPAGRALILPMVALAAGRAASLARMIRAGLVEVLRAEYVRTARGKGLPALRVLTRHALRNSLIPVL